MTNIKMQPKFTPRKSVVLFCRACNGDCSGLCNSKTCVLYPYQKSRNLPNSKMFSIKFIKMYCLSSCTARTSKGAKECSDTECPLHPFRLGKNPFIKKDKKFMAELGKNTQFQRRKTANWEAGINDLPSSVQR